MSYTKVSKKDATQISKFGIDLIIPELDNTAAKMVQVKCEEGHFEEFYMDESTFTYTIIEGVGTFVINDEKVDVAPGDTIAIPPGNRIYYFGKLSMVLQTSPPYDPNNEHHVRDLTRKERFEVFGDWIERNYQKELWKDYLRAVPRKRMAAGVLFFNQQDHVLLVKPNHFPRFQAPGGIVEYDESPHDTAARETKEEIGIARESLEFLQVGYLSAEHDMVEALFFFFDGGTLREEEIQSITKHEEYEIKEFRFFDPDELTDENARQAHTIKAACRARGKASAGYSQQL